MSAPDTSGADGRATTTPAGAAAAAQPNVEAVASAWAARAPARHPVDIVALMLSRHMWSEAREARLAAKRRHPHIFETSVATALAQGSFDPFDIFSAPRYFGTDGSELAARLAASEDIVYDLRRLDARQRSVALGLRSAYQLDRLPPAQSGAAVRAAIASYRQLERATKECVVDTLEHCDASARLAHFLLHCGAITGDDGDTDDAQFEHLRRITGCAAVDPLAALRAALQADCGDATAAPSNAFAQAHERLCRSMYAGLCGAPPDGVSVAAPRRGRHSAHTTQWRRVRPVPLAHLERLLERVGNAAELERVRHAPQRSDFVALEFNRAHVAAIDLYYTLAHTAKQLYALADINESRDLFRHGGDSDFAWRSGETVRRHVVQACTEHLATAFVVCTDTARLHLVLSERALALCRAIAVAQLTERLFATDAASVPTVPVTPALLRDASGCFRALCDAGGEEDDAVDDGAFNTAQLCARLAIQTLVRATRLFTGAPAARGSRSWHNNVESLRSTAVNTRIVDYMPCVMQIYCSATDVADDADVAEQQRRAAAALRAALDEAERCVSGWPGTGAAPHAHIYTTMCSLHAAPTAVHYFDATTLRALHVLLAGTRNADFLANQVGELWHTVRTYALCGAAAGDRAVALCPLSSDCGRVGIRKRKRRRRRRRRDGGRRAKISHGAGGGCGSGGNSSTDESSDESSYESKDSGDARAPRLPHGAFHPRRFDPAEVGEAADQGTPTTPPSVLAHYYVCTRAERDFVCEGAHVLAVNELASVAERRCAPASASTAELRGVVHMFYRLLFDADEVLDYATAARQLNYAGGPVELKRRMLGGMFTWATARQFIDSRTAGDGDIDDVAAAAAAAAAAVAPRTTRCRVAQAPALRALSVARTASMWNDERAHARVADERSAVSHTRVCAQWCEQAAAQIDDLYGGGGGGDAERAKSEYAAFVQRHAHAFERVPFGDNAAGGGATAEERLAFATASLVYLRQLEWMAHFVQRSPDASAIVAHAQASAGGGGGGGGASSSTPRAFRGRAAADRLACLRGAAPHPYDKLQCPHGTAAPAAGATDATAQYSACVHVGKAPETTPAAAAAAAPERLYELSAFAVMAPFSQQRAVARTCDHVLHTVPLYIAHIVRNPPAQPDATGSAPTSPAAVAVPVAAAEAVVQPVASLAGKHGDRSDAPPLPPPSPTPAVPETAPGGGDGALERIENDMRHFLTNNRQFRSVHARIAGRAAPARRQRVDGVFGNDGGGSARKVLAGAARL